MSAVSPRTLVVVNPASAGGRTAQRWSALHRALRAAGVEHDVHQTTAPHDATSVTRAALDGGYGRVVAVGGDGTLNEVVNGFFSPSGAPISAGAILGLLPSGTGCDFRRSAGLGIGPTHLAAVLAANHTRLIDLGRIVYDDAATEALHFINIADCGVGGEVAARVNRSGRRHGGVGGTATFLAISLRVLSTFSGRPVRLTLDGAATDITIQDVVVANGRCFGGGMRIAPHARLDDGLFDVVVLPALGRLRTLAAVPSVYRGSHLRQPGVLVRRAREVRIEPLDARPLVFDVDGEQVGRAPASLTCIPGAIRLCVPAEADSTR